MKIREYYYNLLLFDYSVEVVVKRFKELGGKYVTFGSDAHFAEDLAAGLTEAYDAMKAAGFNEMTLFQQRTPLLMPIE